MNVLLLGSGGREHALALKLKASAHLTRLWVCPGNPGIAQLATCLPGNVTDTDAVLEHCRRLSIDLVVVGPEAPLVAGVVDALAAANIAAFGPTALAAEIEGSKAFAKTVMQAANVPTANFEVFDDVMQAAERALAWGAVVVKADGLAAGKGVVVADSGEQAQAAVLSLGRLEAGKRILLEDRLVGPELSVIALCDGERARLFPPAQDHKQLLDGDAGPNTGGMGVYAPAWKTDAAFYQQMQNQIFTPVLQEMKRRERPFRGALFAGLMMTVDGPKVLEFNCRFGDPETQALMLLLEDDLLPLLRESAVGRLDETPLAVRSGASVAVVLAAKGYPLATKTGDLIAGLSSLVQEATVFHSGTALDDGKLVTAGGRVLTVCAAAASIDAAKRSAYRVVNQISFEGMQFRRDIAGRHPA